MSASQLGRFSDDTDDQSGHAGSDGVTQRQVLVETIGRELVRVTGVSAAEIARALQADPLFGADVCVPARSERRLDDAQLNERETEVLSYIAAGLSNAAVADAMFLSVNTIKSHIRAAYRKVGVSTRSQAVRWAVDHGLTGESGHAG